MAFIRRRNCLGLSLIISSFDVILCSLLSYAYNRTTLSSDTAIHKKKKTRSNTTTWKHLGKLILKQEVPTLLTMTREAHWFAVYSRRGGGESCKHIGSILSRLFFGLLLDYYNMFRLSSVVEYHHHSGLKYICIMMMRRFKKKQVNKYCTTGI